MIQAIALRMIAALAAFCLPAAAQTAHPHQQPYADHQSRAVKALSDQQIADLRAGRGMGLALPAELNGYPGPLHVLENADALGLSQAQRDRTTELFAAMKAEAMPLGEQLIQQETALDRLFASKTVESASLESATSAIGATQGALRAAHLRYHLAMMDLLKPEQVQRYAELRGYRDGTGQPAHGHGGHAR